MKLIYKKTAIIFLSFLLLFGVVNFVLANDSGDKLTSDLVALFTNLLRLSALLAVVVVTIGGVLWLASFGNPNLKSEGTDIIKAGILGLLIVMCSWLIAYTINPKLLIFDIKSLTEYSLGKAGGSGGDSPFAPQNLFYNEIPIGMLSEQLLTGKINCYEFDINGDPVAGEPVKTDGGKEIRGPTYIDHDRVDCFLKLTEAVEKKSLIAETLSKKIMEDMDKCKCSLGNCKNTCSQPNADGTDEGCKLTADKQDCEGACRETSTAGCSNSDTPKGANYWRPNDTYMSSCPEDVKNKIQGYLEQHGDGEKKKIQPFEIAISKECETCTFSIKEKYYGLDEFYTEKTTLLGEPVEKTAQVDEKDFEYIDLSCTACIYGQKDYQTCLTDRQKCLAKTPWGKLNLIKQITYLKEKMDKIKQDIKKDLEALIKAGGDISSCAMPQSYIDLKKREEISDENSYKFEIKKSYQNPTTEEPFDISRYCNGFNYGNSSCDQKCSDICPINKDNIICYECEKCDDNIANYQQCLENRKVCINRCYTNRACANGEFNNYKDCMTQCNTSCTDLCSVKYLKCSKEYELCNASCGKDSTCLLNNIDSCLLKTDAASACRKEKTDEAKQQCIDNLYKCEYGSSQNSGYSECLKDQKSEDYSSSYLWQNKDKQVCKDAYAKGFNLPSGVKGFCIEANPETAKCPTSSACPECSCNSVEETPIFSVEGTIDAHELDLCNPYEDPAGAPSSYPECEEYTSESIDQGIKEYRIVSSECNEYAYNDDPLTFYCRQDWWKEPETQREDATGDTMICPNGTQTPEIPVGNMVDDAKKWADNFLTLAEKASESTKKMIDALKEIGDDKRYCQCNSKYLSGNPVCKTCCNYIEPVPIYDEFGMPTGEMTEPDCQIDACKGNSCQGIIIKLEEVLNRHTEVKGAFIELYVDLMADSRTDVLKELTYSRNQVNVCSSAQNLVGQQKTRMLSCQRILDDIIPPEIYVGNKTTIEQQEIYHYCRGVMAGKILDTSVLMDNWFCCEQATKKVEGMENADMFKLRPGTITPGM